jgi:hypothetical protein
MTAKTGTPTSALSPVDEAGDAIANANYSQAQHEEKAERNLRLFPGNVG